MVGRVLGFASFAAQKHMKKDVKRIHPNYGSRVDSFNIDLKVSLIDKSAPKKYFFCASYLEFEKKGAHPHSGTL